MGEYPVVGVACGGVYATRWSNKGVRKGTVVRNTQLWGYPVSAGVS